MNRANARKAANNFKGSISDLRRMINAKRGAGGMSRVNLQFTIEEALDIYERAIEGRDGAEYPKMFAFSDGSGGGSLDRMIVQNIHRDCA